MPQHRKLIIALISAVVVGLIVHPFADLLWLQAINTHVLQPIGQIFLRLIFMIVVPLIFSALVVATHELSMSHGIGKTAAKTFALTLLVSSMSVVIGITLVNTIRPGDGFAISPTLENTIARNAKTTETIQKNAISAKPISQTIVELIPKNPVDSAARALDGEIIALMVFALIFGIALKFSTSHEGHASNLLPTIFEQIYGACMRIMNFAMKIAPFGVFALVFNTVFISGVGILVSLFLYVFTVVLGLLVQQFVIYPILLKGVAGRSPWQFMKACRETYLYAFSTSSSNATLPKALETAEIKLGIPRKISRFVLTIGATANQNGTAIFEGITVLFLAQVYGVDLSLSQQVYVVLFSILAGVGTAGVPGGSLPLIMILLQSVGIPAEGIGLILGVDRFLDMCRTTINVSGDLVIAAVVATKEGKAIGVKSA